MPLIALQKTKITAMAQITHNNIPEALGWVLSELSELRLLVAQKQSQAEPQDELLTIQQAADILKLSVPTIYGLVSRAEIPHSKKGKRLYFSKQELLDWVKSGRKKTNAEIAAAADDYLTRKRK